MLQSIEELSAVKRKLFIEIPSSVIESELNKAYKELRSSVNVPGFRKGKVPQAILKKRFAKTVEAEIIGRLVPEYYAEAVKESGIIPVAQPSIDDEIKINDDNPVLFSAVVEVRPEVKYLDYEGIELEKQEAAVTEEDVEKQLEWMQKERATYEPSDKEIEDSDMVVIDYFGSIDGEPVKEMEETDYQVVLGSQGLPDEFNNALLHKKINDTCEFSVTYPADFKDKDKAGKNVDFKVIIKEVKKQATQPLDDEFAKDLGYETLDELKKAMENNILEAKEKEIEANYKRALVEKLLKKHDIEAPPTMVENQHDALVESEKNFGRIMGVEHHESDEKKDKLREQAIEEVKLFILLSEIGKAENIKVEDDDVKEYLKQMSLKGGIRSDDLMKYYLSQENALEGLKSEIYNNKIIDLVFSKAHIKET